VKRIALLLILMLVVISTGATICGQGFIRLSINPSAVFLRLSDQRIYEGSFEVQNQDEEVVEVEIALKDFSITSMGGFNTLERGETGEYSLTPYITYEPKFVTLQPGERAEVHYKVELPEGNVGPVWGTLVVGPKKGSLMGGDNSDGGATTLGVMVKCVHPFAILINSTAAVEPQAEVIGGDAVLGEENDHKLLTTKISVSNLCVDLLRCLVSFSVLNKEGEIVYSHQDAHDRAILPDEYRVFRKTFLADTLSPGTYTTRIEVDYGVNVPLTREQTIEISEP